ncbi:hypothetical protein BXZ70DRAFT_507272 [Cristinia sonorae]|uniref:Uncharacterized protein n=1 Tax=Cristinia sonorae TaxID=1940300 RepID=A0A8K0XT22_9AGAR|nr:hypothetical protein BXZ70DRAFT_507272 [Cristinia sonorae]
MSPVYYSFTPSANLWCAILIISGWTGSDPLLPCSSCDGEHSYSLSGTRTEWNTTQPSRNIPHPLSTQYTLW